MRHIIAALSLACVLTAGGVTRQEALDFLYSTMSLPDKADYPAKFYEDNVDASMRAREELPWGKTVPDREFLHFVVPVRVNNENLDMSRPAFYAELRDRVKDLTMAEAILEVNHWCHEKVTYRPSDARTSSPLSSVSQAIGRCGEESTFTVAALRSVGIPARQIYTPRWAHTDDNHAWVEAWADGEWHFIGACEPEPVLDLAWFNAPASRGLLMSTNVAGRYDGPEEVLLAEPLTTRINVTSNYAPVDTLGVRVVNPDGSPAAGAKVNFCIYNYSEFYPAVTKTADSEGRASLLGGLGDMLVWATDGNRFGFAKGRPGDESVLTVTLDKGASWNGITELELTPPASRTAMPVVTEAARAHNDLRFRQEDSIRSAYTATFADRLSAARSARTLKVDSARLADVLTQSRGNHREIIRALAGLPDSLRERGVDLLLAVTEKDRRDIAPEVIADHVRNTVSRRSVGFSDDTYRRYVLSPRIENEGLRPWRAGLSEALPAAGVTADPDSLVRWIEENITPADADNPLRLRMSPEAVMSGRRADALSRGIFFVAAARTLGIPARIDPVTSATQFMRREGEWETVRFMQEGAGEPAAAAPIGTLRLTFTPSGHLVDPKYYSQFSLSRITDGVPRQLEFDEEGTVSSIFASPVGLEAGQYMLVSGQRLADGGVLARCETFTIAPGEDVVRELTIRRDDTAVSVIGSLNAENIYHDLALDADKSLLSTTGRGYYVLGILSPNHEPSAHALNDIRAVASQLEGTGVKLMLLFDSTEAASRFNAAAFPGMPSTAVFGIDNGGVSRDEIIASLHLEDTSYPLFVIADTFNRVVWVSTGYTIGTGERILDILSRVN